MAVILTIEDNVETQLMLRRCLEGVHQVIVCYDLASAKDYIARYQIDLILLDLVLPDGKGLEFFKVLCGDQSMPKIPTIILSSLNDVETRVEGLKSGADDYITKPFEKNELLARIESVLRRGPARHSKSSVTLADVVIDLSKQIVYQVGKDNSQTDLGLTPIEIKILLTLSRHYGHEIPRAELQSMVWGKTYTSRRNVDTHISKMRKKIRNTCIEIQNKRSKGYYLVVHEPQAAQEGNPQELPAFGINHHL